MYVPGEEEGGGGLCKLAALEGHLLTVLCVLSFPFGVPVTA